MRLAYIILAHKLPNQLLRLIERLDADWVTFFVHIDKKTDDAIFRQIAEGVSHRRNVHLLKRYACYWGGFGVVEAALEGLRQVVLHQLQPSHILLLSGQDYPLHSNEAIRRFFLHAGDASFIDYGPLPDYQQYPASGGQHLYERWHFMGQCYFHVGLPWVKRRMPLKMQPFKGSAYWNMSYASARYLLNFIDRNPQVTQFFKYVLTPDELFFQTILLNAHQPLPVVADHLRYTDWAAASSPMHPKTLTIDDYARLANSPALFARKFDESADSTILQMLDARFDYLQ